MKIAKATYLRAILWFIFSVFISASNDLLTKKLGTNLPSYEVVFLRFLFSTLLLVPLMFMNGVKFFNTPFILIHFIRAALLFVSITIWCICLKHIPMAQATLLSFTIPLFAVILALIILKEKVGARRFLATVFGFAGVVIVLNPGSMHFKPISLLLLLACLLFALLDVINKKYIGRESTLNMMFYSSLFTTMLSGLPALSDWHTPNANEVLLFVILGLGANLILYAMLKAFALADASQLVPFRYTELIFSMMFGYMFFAEVPKQHLLLGATLIIPCTFMLLYYDPVKDK